MPTKKPKKTTAAEMEEAYNLLMEKIEPELCTYNLAGLKEKYKDETEDQKTMRTASYKHALDTCFAQMKKIVADWKQEMTELKNKVFKFAENKSTEEDRQALDSLEQSF